MFSCDRAKIWAMSTVNSNESWSAILIISHSPPNLDPPPKRTFKLQIWPWPASLIQSRDNIEDTKATCGPKILERRSRTVGLVGTFVPIRDTFLVSKNHQDKDTNRLVRGEQKQLIRKTVSAHNLEVDHVIEIWDCSFKAQLQLKNFVKRLRTG